MNKNLPLLFVAASCATLLLANQQGQSGGAGDPLDQIYPGLFGASSFGEVYPGEFTGDLSLDAIVMDGNTAKLAIAPEVFDSVVTLAAVNDLAVLPGSPKDLAVTVSVGGLQTWERDYAQGTWITTTLQNAASAWGLAGHVAVGDLDGVFGPDLVGVAVDGTTVLLELADGSGGYTSGTSFSSFGGTIEELRLLDFVEETGGAPAVDEIVLFTPFGVEVYLANGTYADSFAWSSSTILSTVVSNGVEVTERLALVTRTSNTDWLLLFDEDGTEGPYSLGNIGAVSLAADDVDGDGDSEIFLSINTANEFLRIDALGGALPSYDTAGMVPTAFGVSGRNPALNQAGIGLGDFDSDGALEALLPTQGDPSGTPAVQGTLELVDVETPSWPGLEVHVVAAQRSLATNSLRFTFGAPNALIEVGPGQVLELQVQVWHTPDFGQNTVVGTYDDDALQMPNPGVYEMDLPDGYDITTSTDVFSLVVRQVVMEAGALHSQGPATVALTTGETYADLLANDPTIANFLYIYDDGTGVPTAAGVGDGGTVPPTQEEQQPSEGSGSGGSGS